MQCPHCGGEIVTYGESYTERVNTAGQPMLNLAAHTTIYPVITNGNGQFPWTNTVCAAGAAQPVGDIRYITFGRTHNE